MQTRSIEAPAGIRELAAAAGVLLVLSRFVDGAAPWVIAVLLFGAYLFGALQVFHDAHSTTRAHGVPIESLLDPAVLAFGSIGVLHLVPIGLLEVPALVAILWLLVRSLALEARLAQATTPPSAADRTAVLSMTMVAGLAAFAGIAALVPGALPDPAAVVNGGPVAPPSPSLVFGLAAADGLIAFLLAYRVAALRSTSIRDVGWAASTAAAIVAIAAAFLRTLAIPGILGPALLVLVFFLWEAIHGSGGAPARRRDPRRIWETLLLVALGLVVIVWSVGLRSS
ncbi:MAG TPA: hypothetical protein VGI98_00035 [Candidatus Limnocylindrales bacterium]|jgi:hypothetical protein